MVNPSADSRPIYTIGADDRLVFVNAAWLAFGHGDASGRLVAEQFVGRSLWDVLPGQQVRQVWEVLFERVRKARAPIFVPMRADTATQRRLIDVQLQPCVDGAIEHTCEPIWFEDRAAAPLLDPAYPRDGRTLRSCGWCMRVQVRIGVWQEIEDAHRVLNLEGAASLPVLEPGVCVTCKQSLLNTFPALVA